MNKKYFLRSKKLWIIAAIPLLTVIYFFDNIKGQYRFMQYCKNEGGLRIHEPLKKGVGWQARDYNDAKTAAQLKHVGFVRFINANDSKKYDLRYIGENPQRDESFEKIIFDELMETHYIWAPVNQDIYNEIRLGRSGYEIWNRDRTKILVSYYKFGYSLFDRDKSLLYAPSGTGCFNEPGRILSELNTAFETDMDI